MIREKKLFFSEFKTVFIRIFYFVALLVWIFFFFFAVHVLCTRECNVINSLQFTRASLCERVSSMFLCNELS